MNCSHCGHESGRTEIYCIGCGQRISDFCSRCTYYRDQNLAFCGVCGKSFLHENDLVNSLTRAGKLDVLRKYLPRQVFDSLIATGELLRNEKRDVTVIFADISGFTTYSEQHEPEEVTEMLNACFLGLVGAVQRYDGMVDKFIGDCVMALFGAPVAHENDPERAVNCSLEMIEFIASYNKTIDHPIGISIGINAGRVVSGNIGALDRIEYTVIGDAVNLAQRLESQAKSGQILIGEHVFERCSEKFLFHELAPVRVKGKSNPVKLWEVIGPKEKRQLFQADFQRKIVRREKYWEQVRATLEKTGDRSTAVVIKGPPGSGKTTLIDNLILGELAKKRTTIAVSLTDHYGHKFYNGIALLLKTINEILQPETTLSSAIDADLDEGDRIFLAYLLDLDFDPNKIIDLDRDDRFRGVLRVVQKLLVYYKKFADFFLVIDNLQKIDDQSLNVLKSVGDDENVVHLKWVGATRNDPRFEGQSFLHAIAIDPFDRDEIGQLLRLLMDDEAAPRFFVDLIAGASQGNPLFAIELFQMFEKSKKVHRFDNRWIVDEEIEKISMPTNLASLYQSKLDRLQPRRKQLASTIAVIGQSFSLAECLAVDEREIEENDLAFLVDDGILYRSNGKFHFVNPFLHSAAYELNIKQERERLHEILARHYETSDEKPEIERILEHYRKSPNVYKTIEYLAKTFRLQRERFEIEEAFRTSTTIVELIENHRLDRWSDNKKAQQLCKYTFANVEIAYELQSFDAALTRIDRCISISRDHALPGHTIAALTLKGRILAAKKFFDKSFTCLDQAIDLAQKNGLTILEIDALNTFVILLCESGSLQRGLQYNDLVIARLNENPDLVLSVEKLGSIYNARGNIYFKLGRLDEASDAYNRAFELAGTNDRDMLSQKAMGNLAAVALKKGDTETALKLALLAYETACKVGDRLGQTKHACNIGLIHMARREPKEARSHFENAHTLAKQIHFREAAAMSLMHLDKIGDLR